MIVIASYEASMRHSGAKSRGRSDRIYSLNLNRRFYRSPPTGGSLQNDGVIFVS